MPGPTETVPSEVKRLRALLDQSEKENDQWLLKVVENWREIEKLRKIFGQIAEWDSLNPPDPGSDFPWLKRLVNEAMDGGKVGITGKIADLELLGKAAYLAYSETTGGRSAITGDPLPVWEQQQPLIREAWRAAADAVVMMAALDRHQPN